MECSLPVLLWNEENAAITRSVNLCVKMDLHRQRYKSIRGEREPFFNFDKKESFCRSSLDFRRTLCLRNESSDRGVVSPLKHLDISSSEDESSLILRQFDPYENCWSLPLLSAVELPAFYHGTRGMNKWCSAHKCSLLQSGSKCTILLVIPPSESFPTIKKRRLTFRVLICSF